MGKFEFVAIILGSIILSLLSVIYELDNKALVVVYVISIVVYSLWFSFIQGLLSSDIIELQKGQIKNLEEIWKMKDESIGRYLSKIKEIENKLYEQGDWICHLENSNEENHRIIEKMADLIKKEKEDESK